MSVHRRRTPLHSTLLPSTSQKEPSSENDADLNRHPELSSHTTTTSTQRNHGFFTIPSVVTSSTPDPHLPTFTTRRALHPPQPNTAYRSHLARTSKSQSRRLLRSQLAPPNRREHPPPQRPIRPPSQNRRRSLQQHLPFVLRAAHEPDTAAFNRVRRWCGSWREKNELTAPAGAVQE